MQPNQTNQAHKITVLFMGSKVSVGFADTIEEAWQVAQSGITGEYSDIDYRDLYCVHEYEGNKQACTAWEALTTFC